MLPIKRGFTLVELMIVVIFIGTIVSVVIVGFLGGITKDADIQWGANGLTETRCIKGYNFVVGQDGSPRQILDEFGKGSKC